MRGKRWMISLAIAGAMGAGAIAGIMIASAAPTVAVASLGSSSLVSDGLGTADIASTPATAPRGPHAVGNCTETPLTGDVATKVTDAAKAAVPGATVDRVESDCDTGSPYEAHLTKADGSHVTAYVNAAFKVTKIATCGHGPGGPGDRRGARQDTTGQDSTGAPQA